MNPSYAGGSRRSIAQIAHDTAYYTGRWFCSLPGAIASRNAGMYRSLARWVYRNARQK